MIEKQIEIVFNKNIRPGIYLMGLRSPEMVEAARPGQFVMIRVRSGSAPLLRRPFSICGTRDGGLFLVLYRVVGEGTAIMADTKEGDQLSVLGPLGKGFQVPKGNHTSLLVTGGMGIAALLFLAQAMKTDNFQFMAGFGSTDEMITVDQIGGPHIDFSIATDDGTTGYAGPVTGFLEEYFQEQEPEKEALSVFTCGPKPMLKKVAAMCIGRKIPCQVSLETSMACGLGACQGCAVKASSDEMRTYYHVCRDGPVFPVKAIDWDSL